MRFKESEECDALGYLFELEVAKKLPDVDIGLSSGELIRKKTEQLQGYYKSKKKKEVDWFRLCRNLFITDLDSWRTYVDKRTINQADIAWFRNILENLVISKEQREEIDKILTP